MRANREMWMAAVGFALFGVAVTTAAISSCGGTIRASSDPDAGEAGGGGGDATLDPLDAPEGIDVPSFIDGPIVDAGTDRDKPPDAGPPPLVACGPDATTGVDGPECAAPPSRCLGGRWLVSYANGRCVNGACEWDTILTECAQGCVTMPGDGGAGYCNVIAGK